MERPQISKELVRDVVKIIEHKIEDRLDEKGRGIFVSRHEVMGVILEEFNEAIYACENEELHNFMGEILDVAVGCAIALASFRTEKMEW